MKNLADFFSLTKMLHERSWLKKGQQSREINEDFCNNNDDWNSRLLFLMLSRT